jgi:hypothetical protein
MYNNWVYTRYWWRFCLIEVTDQLWGFELLNPSPVSSVYSVVVPVWLKLLGSSVDLSSWNLHQYLYSVVVPVWLKLLGSSVCFESLKPSPVSSVYSVVVHVPVWLKLLISSEGLSSWNLHQYLVYTQLLYLSDWSYWAALWVWVLETFTSI